MSLQVQRLSKEVLNSYENTRSFLESRTTIVEIAKQRDLYLNEPLFFTTVHSSTEPIQTEPIQSDRCWTTSQQLTAPIRSIMSAFLRINKPANQIEPGFSTVHTTKKTWKTYSYATGPCEKQEQGTGRLNPCLTVINVLLYPIRWIIINIIRGIGDCLGNIIPPLRLLTNRIAKRIEIGFAIVPYKIMESSQVLSSSIVKTLWPSLLLTKNPYAYGTFEFFLFRIREDDFLKTLNEKTLSPASPQTGKPSNLETKVSLLGLARNKAREELNELIDHPPIKIMDSRLQKWLLYTDQLPLFRNGICRGMSGWFVYLYLQTKHLYAEPQKHMIALCKLFEKGAPLEAVLLQGLFTRKGKILNCSFGEQKEVWGPTPVQTIALTKTKGDKQIINPSLVEKELGNLKIGAYACGFPIHQCVYTKTSPQLSYWFDPNLGIFEIRGPDQGAKLFACLNNPSYFGNEEKTTTPSIELNHVELRDSAPHIGPASN